MTRLLRMITEIKGQPRQSPERLWSGLGVSRAQFYKDRDELKHLGFRFHFDRQARRFVVDEDPFLPVEDLTLSERLLLLQAVRHLCTAGDYGLSFHALKAARKLITTLQGTASRLMSELFDDWLLQEGFGCTPSLLDRLQQAWAENRRIVIAYRKVRSSEVQEYELDPYHIFFRKRALYVEGFCPTRKAVRTFRVNRITDIRFTGMHFAVREDYDFGARQRRTFFAFGGEKAERVTVRFAPEVRGYIEEVQWSPTQQLTPRPDGSLLFAVEVAEPREVLWWVLSWGAKAEILEPGWLRKEAEAEAQNILNLYRNESSNTH